MKKILLIILLKTSYIFAASEAYLGARTNIQTSALERVSSGFQEDDFEPVPISLLFGVKKDKDSESLHLDLSASFLESKAQLYYFNIGQKWLKILGSRLNTLWALEGMFSNVSEDSVYHESVFDNTLLGLKIGVEYDILNHLIYFNYNYRRLLTARLSISESLTTKIKFSHDDVFTLCLKSQRDGFNYLTEVGFYSFGERKVASREFYLSIPEETVQVLRVGIGYRFKSIESWITFNSVGDFNDKISQYYQAPHFVPEHFLSKSYVTMDVKWKL